MTKKYELVTTDTVKSCDGRTLYRIRALVAIAASGVAVGDLGVVVRYGIDSIKDQIDREHIIAAHDLVTALWRAQQ